MRTRHIMVAATAALLAVALVGYAETNTGTGVITVGPVETPVLLTPRVRVANDRTEPLDIWFVPAGVDELQRLGSVPALGTESFALPKSVEAMRIVIQPRGTRGTPFVSGDINVDLQTDVSLRVAGDLGSTIVEVGKLQFTGGR